jgi:son of sevenless-like protein
MNNFSTMFAVLAGLNSSIVLRLKKTWEVSVMWDGLTTLLILQALSAKYKLIMDRLQTVIDHSKVRCTEL